MPARSIILRGVHPRDGSVFAAVDPQASEHIRPCVSETRLGAMLAPYRDEDSAKAALSIAGAKLEGRLP